MNIATKLLYGASKIDETVSKLINGKILTNCLLEVPRASIFTDKDWNTFIITEENEK